MSSDAQLKAELVQFLEGLGYSASECEESSTPMPDLRVADSRDVTYVVEVKARTTSWIERADAVSQGSAGRVLRRVDKSKASNSVAGDLEHAASQLDGGARVDDLRLVWILADATDQFFLYEEVRRTAYGVKLAIALEEGLTASREAYYATYAAFASHRFSIDGILVGPFQGLFLNNLSPRYERLKNSAIAAACAGHVLDPAAIEREGGCYMTPDTGEAPQPESVKRRLAEAYGITVVALDDFTRFSAAVEVPAPSSR